MSIMERERPVAIFEFSDGVVTDWVAARTLKEAKACYVENYSAKQLEEIENCEERGIRALTPSEMDKFFYMDEEDGPKRSFADQLRKLETDGATFPQHFACTEF